jgi:hypothetical protein
MLPTVWRRLFQNRFGLFATTTSSQRKQNFEMCNIHQSKITQYKAKERGGDSRHLNAITVSLHGTVLLYEMHHLQMNRAAVLTTHCMIAAQ